MNKTGPKPLIGLVGGIGSGKSSVAGHFRDQGAAVIDADAIAHDVLRKPAIRDRLVPRFGNRVLDASGEIDRPRLGMIVFEDAAARRDLEAIVHPAIAEEIREEILRGQADLAITGIVLDAPLLLEVGYGSICDKIVYVDAPREVRLTRVAARGWDEAELARREAAQMPLEKKLAAADFVVDNGGTVESARTAVDEILAVMRNR